MNNFNNNSMIYWYWKKKTCRCILDLYVWNHYSDP